MVLEQIVEKKIMRSDNNDVVKSYDCHISVYDPLRSTYESKPIFQS